MKKKFLAILAAGVFMFGAVEMSQALPVDVNDITLNGDIADYAYGPIDGNDDTTAINLLIPLGTDWIMVAKDNIGQEDDVSGNLGGYNFSVTASSGQSGTWSLLVSGSSFPVDLDLVIALKGGTNFAAYFFDPATLSGTTNSGTWEMEVKTPNGRNIADLSHLSVYARDIVPTAPVPEPATMLLFGTGLAGLAAARRRKKAC